MSLGQRVPLLVKVAVVLIASSGFVLLQYIPIVATHTDTSSMSLINNVVKHGVVHHTFPTAAFLQRAAPSRVVLITGGNQGIGFGVVKAFCEAPGTMVVFTVRSEEKGKDTVRRLPSGCSSHYLVMDVTDHTSIDSAIEKLKSLSLGPIRYAVHNQGISEGDAKPRKWKGETAKLVIDVNWYGTKAVYDALRPLMATGHHHMTLFTSSDHGQLKNIIDPTWRETLRKPTLTLREIDGLMKQYLTWALEHGTRVPKYATSAYALTKVALVQYARVLARDTPGLIVNAFHPGYIKTVHNGWRGKMSPEWAAKYVLASCELRNVTGRFLHKAQLFSPEN